jgi:hypothetical protein
LLAVELAVSNRGAQEAAGRVIIVRVLRLVRLLAAVGALAAQREAAARKAHGEATARVAALEAALLRAAEAGGEKEEEGDGGGGACLPRVAHWREQRRAEGSENEDDDATAVLA